MLRSIIAGTAMAGALTVGVAGVAGAAATSTPTAGGTPSAAVCAKAAKVETRVHTWETKVAQRLPKAEAREATAKTDGNTKLADYIAKRITRVQDRETKVNARLAKIEAKCGTTSSGGTGSTTS